MKLQEAIDLFRKVRKEYFAIEQGYSNREQLQYWRQQLVFVYAELAEMTNKVSAQKIFQEEQKHVVRAEQFKALKEEASGTQGGDKSATAINAQIGGTDAYKDWTKKYSEAYGSWQAFGDVKESVKVVIDSIGSHLRNIATSDYLDPK